MYDYNATADANDTKYNYTFYIYPKDIETTDNTEWEITNQLNTRLGEAKSYFDFKSNCTSIYLN